jgi:phage RecT family recombinase
VSAPVQTGTPGIVASGARNAIVELFTGDKAQTYIKAFLPEGADLQRVAATVLLAIQKDDTGALAKCTPRSLILGVARIQQWGLELGTTAHLLPFKNTKTNETEATPVADYKGLAELMIGSGAVKFIQTKAVYEGDFFEYSLGVGESAFLRHRPGPKAKRGPITHAYVIFDLQFGRQVFDVMLAEDIEEIRQNFSKQWKSGPLKAWYAMKTVLRQASKLVPKNPRLAKAFAVMDQDRELEGEDLTPTAPRAAALRPGLNEDEKLEQIRREDAEMAALDDDDTRPAF